MESDHLESDPRWVFLEELRGLIDSFSDAGALEVVISDGRSGTWVHPATCPRPAPVDLEALTHPWKALPVKLSDGSSLWVAFRSPQDPATEGTLPGLVEAARRLEVMARRSASASSPRVEEKVMRAELEIAGRIQQSLLFGRPPLRNPTLSFGAFALPSREVGGDFFDFYPHGKTCVDVLIGDVMGKGVPAALVGAAVKGQFLRFTRGARRDESGAEHGAPRQIVSAVHRAIAPQLIDLECFVTACYARFDTAAHALTFVDCGHTHTLMLSGGTGTITPLGDTFPPGVNLPFGVDAETRFEQTTVPFEPGDLVLLYSDGVTEAVLPDGSRLGLRALIETLEGTGDRSPQALIRAIRHRLEGLEVVDDVTFLAIRFVAGPGTTHGLEVPGALHQIERVRGFLREVARDLTTPHELEDLQLAVTEGVTNIVRHAYGPDQEGTVRIEIDLTPGVLTVRLLDTGTPLDTRRLEALGDTPPAPGEHGYGLFLIHNLMDEMEYGRDEEGRNCLTLTKRLQGKGDAG